MTVNGSPYSDEVHVEEIATRTPPEVQLRLVAWWTPKLWPSSWARTRRLSAPLFQLCDPDTSPRPDQPPHELARGKAYTKLVKADRFAPAAAAAARAFVAQFHQSQVALLFARVYQPKTCPLTLTAPRDSSSKKLFTESPLVNITAFAVAGRVGLARVVAEVEQEHRDVLRGGRGLDRIREDDGLAVRRQHHGRPPGRRRAEPGQAGWIATKGDPDPSPDAGAPDADPGAAELLRGRSADLEGERLGRGLEEEGVVALVADEVVDVDNPQRAIEGGRRLSRGSRVQRRWPTHPRRSST